jgi:hypothetical protein
MVAEQHQSASETKQGSITYKGGLDWNYPGTCRPQSGTWTAGIPRFVVNDRKAIVSPAGETGHDMR